MLELSSTFSAKLICSWIGDPAGGALAGSPGGFGFAFAGRNLAADQRVEISGGFQVFDVLKDHRRFRAHFTADLLIVFLRKFAALVLEVEVLNIAENDFLLPLKQIPFGFFDNRGF